MELTVIAFGLLGLFAWTLAVWNFGFEIGEHDGYHRAKREASTDIRDLLEEANK